jgi:peptidase E
VGGGNTANMLSVWSVHGLDKALIAAYQQGVVLAGISAGAICWFQGGITDSFGTPYRLLKKGLGLLPGLFCPHLSSEPERHVILSRNVVKTSLFGYGVEDDAAIHFVDDRVSHGVCSSPYAKATQFTPCIDGFYESEIAMRDLCSQGLAE